MERNKKTLQNFGGVMCGGLRRRLENTVAMYFREAGFDNVYWIEMAGQDRARCRV
jgi:hypothetical protein